MSTQAAAAPAAATAPASGYALAHESSNWLRSHLPSPLSSPKVAVICGSGLSGLAQIVDDEPKCEFAYEDIPNFPSTKVPGHPGKLVFGNVGTRKSTVLLIVGRAQYVFTTEHPGHHMDTVTFATKVCRLLNISTLIVTNAAGGLNPGLAVGDIVMISDHINIPGLAGIHPLRGLNEDAFGPRFPALSDAYDLELRRRAHRAWRELKLDEGTRRLHEGVYAFVSGPSFETRAECRLLQTLGADVVGMSTVPEVIVARHADLKVLAFSLVTNKAVIEPGPAGNDPDLQPASEDELRESLSRGKPNHDEVLHTASVAASDMQKLVGRILEELVEP